MFSGCLLAVSTAVSSAYMARWQYPGGFVVRCVDVEQCR